MQKYYKPFIIIVILAIICIGSKAEAISEYGLRCADNRQCVKCANDIDCIKCMHVCWNAYGYADSDTKNSMSSHSTEDICIIKWAKWCNAQCWDPDDTKKPDYISTKPKCTIDNFAFPKDKKSYEKKPNF